MTAPRPEVPGPTPAGAIHVVAAAIVEDGRCLVALRSPTMTTPNCWELPGGKVDPAEQPRAALRREIEEELCLHIEVQAWIGRSLVDIAGRQICLDAYRARLVAGTLQLREHQASRWITAAEIDSLPWAPADQPLLASLANLLSANP